MQHGGVVVWWKRSQNQVWAGTLGVLVVLGGLVVAAPAVSPFFLVPVVAAAWWGGPALPVVATSFAVVSLAWAQRLLPAPSWGGVVSSGLVFALAALATVRVRDELRRTRRAAHVDPLTGVLTRRRFYELAEREVSRARRSGLPLSVVYLDVDGLKALNDGEGHAVGDAALKAIGGVLRATLREVDVVGRVGGDEFVVVLPDTSACAARVMLQRLKARLAAESRRTGLPLSVSGGVTCHALPVASAKELVAQADREMYAQRRRRTPPVPVHVFAPSRA